MINELLWASAISRSRSWSALRLPAFRPLSGSGWRTERSSLVKKAPSLRLVAPSRCSAKDGIFQKWNLPLQT
ncbi:hypothetical protein, partial [Massilia psychrophila]|uniref:hypothetical protein n=1 Tax=Massilia psychrophila TaxID=1603353 RepID=UPI001E53DA35